MKFLDIFPSLIFHPLHSSHPYNKTLILCYSVEKVCEFCLETKGKKKKRFMPMKDIERALDDSKQNKQRKLSISNRKPDFHHFLFLNIGPKIKSGIY